MASFIPRRVFPNLESLPRSYFLGHHRAGLEKMKTMLSNIDLIIECRDFRVPITSSNPLFEENLAGKERVIIYTKTDLGHAGTKYRDKMRLKSIKDITQEWHYPSKVIFNDPRNTNSMRLLLDAVQQRAAAKDSLLPFRMMVVGMPNVGKSSLLNAMRNFTLHRPKASRTGAQPGVTRKMGSDVKILEADQERPAVYLIDSPGVFIPFVPNAESMLKLALCGCVKDTIIPPTILADYLLYHLNLYNPEIYYKYSVPTNDIVEFLSRAARGIGRLQKGGTPDIEATALWMIHRWRVGTLGLFVLDDVSLASFADAKRTSAQTLYASLSQGRKADQKLRANERLSEAG